MKKGIVLGFVLGFSIGPVFLLVAGLGAQPPFTIDKSVDFKPLGLKGHEGCYVAEVGKGVKVSVMYGTDGKWKGKMIAMKLILSADAYKAYPRKLEGFQYHEEIDSYVKHFYPHELPMEMHMEHNGHKEHKHGE